MTVIENSTPSTVERSRDELLRMGHSVMCKHVIL